MIKHLRNKVLLLYKKLIVLLVETLAGRNGDFMAIENIEEVKTYFEANKDKDEVKAFVSGLNPVTVDKVKSLVDTDKDLKSWLDSEKDKHSSKSLETWKTNNLQKLIDEEVKKRHPDADPKDSEIANLKAQFEKMQKEAAKKDITNNALKLAQEKKLPIELIDFLIADDEQTTQKNLEKLADVFAKHDEAIKTELLKGNSYVPPTGNKQITANPWSKEHYNLTLQGQLLKENPDLAKKYMAEATK